MVSVMESFTKYQQKHCDMDDVVDLRIQRVLGEDENSESSEDFTG